MRHIYIGLFWLFLVFITPALCLAGALTVVPTKLFLSAGKKTEVLKVRNEGDEKMTLQVETVKWGQGDEGNDIYEPTEDLAFFPKIFTVEKGQEWLLRIAAKEFKAGVKEQAYRIILQEIPVVRPGESQLMMALKVSVPLFIRPQKETAKEMKDWSIEKVELTKGGLLVKVRNNGNSHITVGKIAATGLDASDKEVFKTDGSGWYVLPGNARAFGIKISRQDCLGSSVIKVTTEAGETTREAKLAVNKDLCPKETEEKPVKEKGSVQ